MIFSVEWPIPHRFKILLIGEIYLDLSQWHTSVLSAFACHRERLPDTESPVTMRIPAHAQVANPD